MDRAHQRYVHNALLASLATECIAMAALAAAMREQDRRLHVLSMGLHIASAEWVSCAVRAIADGHQD